MCCSNDGKLIASGDHYRYIYVFNAETKEEIGCFPNHKSAILYLAFSANGKLLVSTSTDNSVMVSDIEAKTKKVIMSKDILLNIQNQMLEMLNVQFLVKETMFTLRVMTVLSEFGVYDISLNFIILVNLRTNNKFQT